MKFVFKSIEKDIAYNAHATKLSFISYHHDIW